MRVDFSTIPEELDEYPWGKILLQDEIWMDKYGTEIKIKDMSSAYIRNVLPFVQRAIVGLGLRMIKMADGPLGPRSVMAQDAFDEELMQLADPPLERALTGELRKREEAAMVDPDRYNTVLTRHDG